MRNSKQILWAVFFAFLSYSQTALADEQAQVQADGGSITFQSQEDADVYQKQYGVQPDQRIFIGQAQADAYYQELNNKRIEEAKQSGKSIGIDGKRYGDPNAIKEDEYTEKHIVTDPDGSRHFRPNVTERTVISDRMIILPDGSTEFWKQGIDKAMQEQQEALAQHQKVLDAQRKKIYGNNPDAESRKLMEEGKARDQKSIEEEAKKIEELKKAKEKHEQEERERLEKEYQERYKVLKSVEPKGSE